MTTFWRFLYYRLKSSALRTVIFTVLSTVICLIGIWNENQSDDVKYCQCGLYMLATALCITASIVPLFELAGLKNRRNLDTLYFFPLGRKKMATAYFLSGWMQVVFIYTVTFIASLTWLISQTDYFALIYMLPYYFLSLVLAFVIFAVFSFLFLQANTVADGVLFCALWIFFLWAVSNVVLDFLFYTRMLTYNKIWLASSWGILYTPMNNLTVLYQDLIESNCPERWDGSVKQIMENFSLFFIWGAIGFVAAIGYFNSFVKKGAEKAGEISNSWFGYKTLIPIYGCCLLYTLGPAWIHILIYAIVMITGYIIYRRGFKFKFSDGIVTVIGAVIPFLMSFMIYLIRTA